MNEKNSFIPKACKRLAVSLRPATHKISHEQWRI